MLMRLLLLQISNNTIYVRGVDLIDKTPILDIKVTIYADHALGSSAS